jgi:hypothetical protein
LTSYRGPRQFRWSDLWPPMGAKAAIIAMFAIFLLTGLAAGWLHLAALTGFGFAAGSAVAAGRTRRSDLLPVAASPPLLFLLAVTSTELISLHVKDVAAAPEPVIAGVFLTLTAAAPWLFGGLAGALLIATVRGLPQCIRDLRGEIADAALFGDYQAGRAD